MKLNRECPEQFNFECWSEAGWESETEAQTWFNAGWTNLESYEAFYWYSDSYFNDKPQLAKQFDDAGWWCGLAFEARDWVDFVNPETNQVDYVYAKRWYDVGISRNTALVFISVGIYDPNKARALLDSGLSLGQIVWGVVWPLELSDVAQEYLNYFDSIGRDVTEIETAKEAYEWYVNGFSIQDLEAGWYDLNHRSSFPIPIDVLGPLKYYGLSLTTVASWLDKYLEGTNPDDPFYYCLYWGKNPKEAAIWAKAGWENINEGARLAYEFLTYLLTKFLKFNHEFFATLSLSYYLAGFVTPEEMYEWYRGFSEFPDTAKIWKDSGWTDGYVAGVWSKFWPADYAGVALLWYNAGFPPGIAADFYFNQGIADPSEARWFNLRVWAETWLDISEARKWWEAGWENSEAEDAYNWYTAGFSPDVALEWRNYFSSLQASVAKSFYDLGFKPDEAKAFYEAGFSAEEASNWRDLYNKYYGVTTNVLKSYADAGFSPETNWIGPLYGLAVLKRRTSVGVNGVNARLYLVAGNVSDLTGTYKIIGMGEPSFNITFNNVFAYDYDPTLNATVLWIVDDSVTETTDWVDDTGLIILANQEEVEEDYFVYPYWFANLSAAYEWASVGWDNLKDAFEWREFIIKENLPLTPAQAYQWYSVGWDKSLISYYLDEGLGPEYVEWSKYFGNNANKVKQYIDAGWAIEKADIAYAFESLNDPWLAWKLHSEFGWRSYDQYTSFINLNGFDWGFLPALQEISLSVNLASLFSIPSLNRASDYRKYVKGKGDYWFIVRKDTSGKLVLGTLMLYSDNQTGSYQEKTFSAYLDEIRYVDAYDDYLVVTYISNIDRIGFSVFNVSDPKNPVLVLSSLAGLIDNGAGVVVFGESANRLYFLKVDDQNKIDVIRFTIDYASRKITETKTILANEGSNIPSGDLIKEVSRVIYKDILHFVIGFYSFSSGAICVRIPLTLDYEAGFQFVIVPPMSFIYRLVRAFKTVVTSDYIKIYGVMDNGSRDSIGYITYNFNTETISLVGTYYINQGIPRFDYVVSDSSYFIIAAYTWLIGIIHDESNSRIIYEVEDAPYFPIGGFSEGRCCVASYYNGKLSFHYFSERVAEIMRDNGFPDGQTARSWIVSNGEILWSLSEKPWAYYTVGWGNPQDAKDWYQVWKDTNPSVALQWYLLRNDLTGFGSNIIGNSLNWYKAGWSDPTRAKDWINYSVSGQYPYVPYPHLAWQWFVLGLTPQEAYPFLSGEWNYYPEYAYWIAFFYYNEATGQYTVDLDKALNFLKTLVLKFSYDETRHKVLYDYAVSYLESLGILDDVKDYWQKYGVAGGIYGTQESRALRTTVTELDTSMVSIETYIVRVFLIAQLSKFLDQTITIVTSQNGTLEIQVLPIHIWYWLEKSWNSLEELQYFFDNSKWNNNDPFFMYGYYCGYNSLAEYKRWLDSNIWTYDFDHTNSSISYPISAGPSFTFGGDAITDPYLAAGWYFAFRPLMSTDLEKLEVGFIIREWIRAGWTDPEEAKMWYGLGWRNPDLAYSYFKAGWTSTTQPSEKPEGWDQEPQYESFDEAVRKFREYVGFKTAPIIPPPPPPPFDMGER